MSSSSTSFTAPSRFMALVTLMVALACTPAVSRAGEARTVDGAPASTALNFTVVIPAVLRILENRHPAALFSADMTGSVFSATQRLVLVSTLGKGFCMDLRLNQQQVADWQLKVSGSHGARVEAAEGGYRVCALRPGRFELALEHAFNLKDAKPGGPDPRDSLRWPVSVSLATP